MKQHILDALGPDLYRTGEDVGERHAADWSKEHPCLPAVVLNPRDTADVSRMLALCYAADQPLVIQGGLTGLSGGATPQAGEWALSLDRLNGISELDTASMTLTAGAGTPLEVMQSAAAEAGLRFPLDLGARGSCLAGGLVSTNAGGNQVIRYGMTRSFVLGLVAVLADGTVIPARNKLLKNNSGYDLKQLFIGSEGTLGVVTEATFRLFPGKPARQTALCAVPSFEQVTRLLRRATGELEGLNAFEVMWADYFHESLRVTGSPDPVAATGTHYVLLEAEGGDEIRLQQQVQELLIELLESDVIVDAALAKNRYESQQFWAIRDGISEILASVEAVANFDIGIPVSAMNAFTREAARVIKETFPGSRVYIFGHLGDGNLHLVVPAENEVQTRQIYDRVFRLTGQFGGSIAAEHGVGVLRKPWLEQSRSAEEIELMKRLKLALDPKSILNRGRVFD